MEHEVCINSIEAERLGNHAFDNILNAFGAIHLLVSWEKNLKERVPHQGKIKVMTVESCISLFLHVLSFKTEQCPIVKVKK